MFKEGDVVKWSSQSQGVKTVKRGVIVAVVPKGKRVLKSWRPSKFSVFAKRVGVGDYSPAKLGSSGSRDHESYLVDVDEVLYWPKVCQLKKVK